MGRLRVVLQRCMVTLRTFYQTFDFLITLSHDRLFLRIHLKLQNNNGRVNGTFRISFIINKIYESDNKNVYPLEVYTL